MSREKPAMVLWLLKTHHEPFLVSVRTKHAVLQLQRVLEAHGIACDTLHPNRSTQQRKQATALFASGRVRALIVTHAFVATASPLMKGHTCFADAPNVITYAKTLNWPMSAMTIFATTRDRSVIQKMLERFHIRVQTCVVPVRLPTVHRTPRGTQRAARHAKHVSSVVTVTPQKQKQAPTVFHIGSRRSSRPLHTVST